eukprot:tig00020660_g12556.t1
MTAQSKAALAGADPAAVAALARHLLAADDPQRAAPCLEACARAAFDSYANAEARRTPPPRPSIPPKAPALRQALRYYEDLLARCEAPPRRRARWLRASAECLSRLGMYPRAADCAHAALRLLGRPLPSSRLVMLFRALRAARKAAKREPVALTEDGRAVLTRRPAASDDERELNDEIARVLSVLRLSAINQADRFLSAMTTTSLITHCFDNEVSPSNLAAALALAAQAVTALALRNGKKHAQAYLTLTKRVLAACEAEVGTEKLMRVYKIIAFTNLLRGDVEEMIRTLQALEERAALVGAHRDSIHAFAYRLAAFLRGPCPPEALRVVAAGIEGALEKARAGEALGRSDEFYSVLAPTALALIDLFGDQSQRALERVDRIVAASAAGVVGWLRSFLYGVLTQATARSLGLDRRAPSCRKTAVETALTTLDVVRSDPDTTSVVAADMVVDSMLVLFLAWLRAAYPPDGAGHPAAVLIEVLLPGPGAKPPDAGEGGDSRTPAGAGAPYPPARLVAALDLGVKCLQRQRRNELIEGMRRIGEGIAHSAHGRRGQAVECFAAAAARGGAGEGPTGNDRALYPRDCVLALLLLAAHSQDGTYPRPIPRWGRLRLLGRGPRPAGPVPSPAAALEIAERVAAANAELFFARAARVFRARLPAAPGS